MGNWYDAINAAAAAGYAVTKGEAGWWIITPARPRRPSQELGTYKDERAAWRGAAFLAQSE